MKILVCVKVIKGELNPFDASALECALRLSDDVTVISMAAESCKDTLRQLTRLGAKAVLISDTAFAGSDTLATSYILSAVIQTMDYDLIICGRQSVDGDTAQTGPMLSKRLELPLVCGVMGAERSDEGLHIRTRNGGAEIRLPALITVERGYILRFPSIFSKTDDVTVIDRAGCACDLSQCGVKGSPTRVIKSFENERGRRICKFISMEALFPLIEELIKRPTAERKQSPAYTGRRLKGVWAVGDAALEKAREIADEVVCIEASSAEEIAERAVREKPRVILWNADEWGRKNAAIAAVLLKTGLCADCTELETDGETLFMYRPAQGGSITAKIKCLTLPQMATVRTKSTCEDIIVSGGRGIYAHMI